MDYNTPVKFIMEGLHYSCDSFDGVYGDEALYRAMIKLNIGFASVSEGICGGPGWHSDLTPSSHPITQGISQA